MNTLTFSFRLSVCRLHCGLGSRFPSGVDGARPVPGGLVAPSHRPAQRRAWPIYLRASLAALTLAWFALAPAAAQTYTSTTVAGNGGHSFSGDGGAATRAQLNFPGGVAVDGSGNIYIADTNNYRIRKVSAATGIITTVAGNGVEGFSGDGGAATLAQLNYTEGVAVDGAGNVYLADTDNDRVRKVSAATGIITTVAGNGEHGFSGDGGAATRAQLNNPYGVTIDGSGNLFIADGFNYRIRKVSAATGIITTVAGNGDFNFSGDGGVATSAGIFSPHGVAVDGSGKVYIADRGNSRIRQLTPASATPTRPARPAAVLLYPNPASGAFTVLVPAGAGLVQIELLNALGQPVRHQVAPTGAPFRVETAGLTAGVYTLYLTAGPTVLAKRVILQ